MGRIFPDAICRMYGIDKSLSGSPVVVSGLAIVTDDLVSIVTKQDLPLVYPLVFRM
jgi:hypothetical protein